MASLLMFTILLLVTAIADEGQQAIDSFYDETTASNWVILAGDVIDDFTSKWEENEKWDTINENVETQKGHYVTRKCENIFGSALCLCQFEKLEKIHNCHKGGKKEIKKQQHLRNRYTRRHNSPNAGISAADSMVQNQLNNMVSSLQTNPLFQRFWGKQKDLSLDTSPQDKLFALKEEKIENEIAAAQIEADNNELDDEEVDEIAEEIDELIEEEQEVQQEQDAEEEDILHYDELITDDDNNNDNNDIEAETAEYDDEIIGVLDDEVDDQNELIEKQSQLIEDLKQDNARKEELIDILEEEEGEVQNDIDDDEYVAEDEDEDQYMDDADDDDNEELVFGEDEFYDDDNDEEYDAAEEVDMDVDEDSLAEEEYDELYDVDGENEDETDQFNEEDEHKDTEKDLQKKEQEAIIADTFWGLEIYSIAFMVLCCFCVSCYMQKTKCCGYLAKEEKTFAYSEYHSQGGFKRVFGKVYDEQDDIEMGVDQNDSEEAQALHS